ncbi:phosphatase PAP2 family protein [Clostridium cylindrosporum]|uniref:Membrane-associated phospholipid phosphatase n=1 Tax=Clostridium cylindrosporum DSM 605 TaxID=1121307 RepID=A0A0J8DDP1_CLOCY|nr:phosphatase PAP2 family protein [Clostridium cylindrosporum]KMT22343.1 membrane-associated phospholipid phosphatase [Clostridium cylindrosporum DSM 605]
MDFIQNIDNTILNFIHENFSNSLMDKVMPFISSIANNGMLWIIIAIIFILTSKHRKYGVTLLIALTLSLVIGEVILKPLIGRIRPFNVNDVLILIPSPSGFSFPSGHSMSSFTAATIIWNFNKRFGVVAFIAASVIAFSRLYLYVHYPTDVIGGAILGIMCGMLSCLIIFKIKKRNRI